jgi:hypothetical protein
MILLCDNEDMPLSACSLVDRVVEDAPVAIQSVVQQGSILVELEKLDIRQDPTLADSSPRTYETSIYSSI